MKYEISTFFLLYCHSIYFWKYIPPPHIQSHFHLHCLIWEQLRSYTKITERSWITVKRGKLIGSIHLLLSLHTINWNKIRIGKQESYNMKKTSMQTEINSLLCILATYPGFISSQASSWLALGASGPRRTLPVSVWVTLTGRSLIWLLSSMG